MFSFEEINYLQEQTIAEIVKNAFLIYRDHFLKFFLSYFLFMFPATVVGVLLAVVLTALSEKNPALFALIYIPYFGITFFISTVASVLVTLMISDICMGDPPNLKRAFKHLSLRLLGKLLITNLLFYFVFAVFLLLLFVLSSIAILVLSLLPLPDWSVLIHFIVGAGMVMALMTSLLFVPAIVILENRWGLQAMLRSIRLGMHYHIRNFIIVCLMSVVVTIVPLLVFFAINVLWHDTGSVFSGAMVGGVLYYLVGFLVQPLNLIYIVLLYYDLRVRKEGYDSSALAEDLRH